MAATQCLAIVGVGLIGGSIGLAARRSGRYGPIIGVDQDSASLGNALVRACIDEVGELTATARRADAIVFCTPVNFIAQQVVAAAQHAKPRTLLTDAGSTKAIIVEDVERLVPTGHYFLGAHPLAGSEKRGVENARADLFDGRLTVLTPTPRTPTSAEAEGRVFWKSLGCRLHTMLPEEHDAALARTSHLPHLVASALAGTLPAELRDFCAAGFRDTTRLAAGDPAMWLAICKQNRMPMIDALGSMQDRIADFKRALIERDADALERLLIEGKKVRDDLGN